MDLLMPIIGCALGIVVSIMSIKVVLDKGKKAVTGAITGAVANKAQQALQSPVVQTALTAGMAVATGGTSLGASAAANAATSGIRMASNAAASTAASTAANAAASKAGKGAMGKLGKAGNLMRGGAEVTAGAAGGSARVGKKIAKDLYNSKFGRKIRKPARFVKNKVYTVGGQVTGKTKELAGNAKNAIVNSKFGQKTKKVITGVKDFGNGVKTKYTSGKEKLSEFANNTKQNFNNKKDELHKMINDKKQEFSDLKDQIRLDYNQSELHRKITGVKQWGRERKSDIVKYGASLKDEFNQDGISKKLRKQGRDRIKKVLESNNPKTGKDHFLGRLFDKTGKLRKKESELTGKLEGELDQISATEEKASLKDRMLVKLSTAKGTARRMADKAMAALNERKEVEAVGVAGESNGAVEAAIPMENYGAVAAIPMYGYGNSEYGFTEYGRGMPMAQLVYNDFSVLKSQRYDRSGSLMSSQNMSNPKDVMNQYANTSGYIKDYVNNNEISTSQHFENAMQAINEHFKERYGNAAYSPEDGRALAQILDRLQTQREIANSDSIRREILAQQQPEKQKVDALVAELGGNSSAANARQNYIETHTETIVAQQISGNSISEEDMQRIREQAQRVVEENFDNRVKNEKGFRDEIFGQEASSALETKFSDIDNEISRRINDAIASNRESLNANFASKHPEVVSGEIDSARIMEDMKKDIEQIVSNQVSNQMSQRAKLQDNPEVVNVTRKQEVAQENVVTQKVSESSENKNIGKVSSGINNPQIEPQVGQRLRNSNLKEDDFKSNLTDNLQGSQARQNNKVQ